MSTCLTCKLRGECSPGTDDNCTEYVPAGDSKSTSSDPRQFAVIHVILYDDARKERVVDKFGMNTWITPEQFKVLKEYFLEITMAQELMK